MKLPQIFILDVDGFITNGSLFYTNEVKTLISNKYGFRVIELCRNTQNVFMTYFFDSMPAYDHLKLY